MPCYQPFWYMLVVPLFRIRRWFSIQIYMPHVKVQLFPLFSMPCGWLLTSQPIGWGGDCQPQAGPKPWNHYRFNLVFYIICLILESTSPSDILRAGNAGIRMVAHHGRRSASILVLLLQLRPEASTQKAKGPAKVGRKGKGMNRRTAGRTDGRTDGRTKKQMNKQMNKQTRLLTITHVKFQAIKMSS